VGSGGASAGAARGVRKGGTGAEGAQHMAGDGGGSAQRRNRGGLEVDEGDLSAVFQKCKDSTVKPR
jgi:hypothetical protein